ncbi:hypothetical protein [Calothrix sp. NIES-2100]
MLQSIGNFLCNYAVAIAQMFGLLGLGIEPRFGEFSHSYSENLDPV